MIWKQFENFIHFKLFHIFHLSLERSKNGDENQVTLSEYGKDEINPLIDDPSFCSLKIRNKDIIEDIRIEEKQQHDNNYELLIKDKKSKSFQGDR
ncbi:hypothetical protein V1477_003230 [Vespula maculifrons]|uniref:Uncharacterized protein n=1 Tax=Vespula maculifrons TaxID=7453 RepID=A0ABD2CTY6_VESMC